MGAFDPDGEVFISAFHSYVSMYSSTEKFYPQNRAKRKALLQPGNRFLGAGFSFREHMPSLPETVII